eukprot:6193112-Pleurochrysis_carterae.AAC.1
MDVMSTVMGEGLETRTWEGRNVSVGRGCGPIGADARGGHDSKAGAVRTGLWAFARVPARRRRGPR